MNQQILRISICNLTASLISTLATNITSNNSRALCFLILPLCLSVGCATAKTVSKAEDIRDDGKSNIVVMSYDMKVYATDKHTTEKNIQIRVHCPQSSKLTMASCFTFSLPLKGRKTIDGYSLYAFEANDAKVMRLEYGDYTATRANYSVLVDRIPDVSCYYSKKKRRDICNRTTKDVNDSHQFAFPEPLAIPVSSGSGCYLGHLSMTVSDGLVEDANMDYNAELTPERLALLSADVQAAVQQHVVRPCNT